MFQKTISALCLALVTAPAFSGGAKADIKPVKNRIVILATTTSVRDTGLLDALIGLFQERTGYTLQSIAVGSGQALQLGRTGEADILWAHSPDEEKRFVEEGYGTGRATFLHNDFVVLGPLTDPAGVRGAKKAADAFKRIADKGALFVSRGDRSGTHRKELKLWDAAGAKPAKAVYLEAGQGMSATLSIASEKRAYVLADRSTYLSMRRNIGLKIVSEGDEALINRYSLILVSASKFPKVNAGGARAFLDFMLSKPAREVIENFGREKYGRQLFFYDYKRSERRRSE